MTPEHILLAMLESKEAQANAKAEWIAEWCDANLPLLLTEELDTNPATLLGELNADQHCQFNEAICLMMRDDDPVPLKQFIKEVLYDGLADLAKKLWGYHLAELQNAMSAEQFERYQQRDAA